VADLEMKDGGRKHGPRGRALVGLGVKPHKLTTYDENNCQKHRLVLGHLKNNEIEWFGGRPPVGGRPSTQGPSLNAALGELFNR